MKKLVLILLLLASTGCEEPVYTEVSKKFCIKDQQFLIESCRPYGGAAACRITRVGDFLHCSIEMDIGQVRVYLRLGAPECP